MVTAMRRQSPAALVLNLRVLWFFVNISYQILPLWLMYMTHEIWPIFLTIGLFFGFVPLFDLIVGDSKMPPGVEENGPFFLWMLCLQGVSHFAVFVAVIGLATSGAVPWWGSLLAVMTIGILNVQCPVVAHEFGHKLGRFNRQASNFGCAIVGMGYFMPQHVLGHHVKVATPEDCASARFGQTSYEFIVSSFPAEVRGGIKLEAERLRRRGLPVLSWHNDVLVSYAMSIAIAAVLVALLGTNALPWILLHHVAAWSTLMLNDYLQHYGLMREMLPNGRRAPAGPNHSWNTDTPFCNLLVFNVQRHSHHHAQPMVPYQKLRDMPSTPRLPTGYFGMMIVALIPPLWFHVMDHRVVAAASGRRDRVNTGRWGHRRLKRLLNNFAVARHPAPSGHTAQ
jgi:alkane 1-monooxygenase